ncbi:MAG: TIR domain-containing protein [Acidobacteria bacterium]|nr:TIR domain-containing protein [Acidobacteriota bacterium]
MSNATVFISYSKHDVALKDKVVKHLGVSQQFTLWDDSRIDAGEDWLQAILAAIESGQIVILLVSVNSLTTDFILREEVPRLLAKRAAGAWFYPIIVGDCDWQGVAWLQNLNVRPVKGRVLGEDDTGKITPHQIDKDLAAIAKEIRQKTDQRPLATEPATTDAPNSIPYRRIPTLPPPKPFVGRVEMLAEIERLFRADVTGAEVIGLISLRGMGGVGKTALASEAAYRFGALFPGGRYWVELRGGDAAGAMRNLLRDLQALETVAPDSKLPDLCVAVRHALAGQRALIILDNAETILSAELRHLTELGATTLVTSRVAIDTTSEISVDKLSPAEALDLLAQRGVNLATERDDALQLCERLGRLALALEITAKRMATYRPRQSCAAALAELNQSRHLVEAVKLPRRNNPEDNVAEAFALSYQPLDEELKLVFQTLGICAQSGTPLEAVTRITEIETVAAREALLRLNELSLAEFDGARIILHPLLHDYAALQAEQEPTRYAGMIERHARYFGLEIGGEYQRGVNEDDGEQKMRGLQNADLEIDNVRLAQERALSEGFTNAELAVELTTDLRLFWQLRNIRELLDWLTQTALLAEKTGQKMLRARLLQAIGDVQSFRKEMDAALASYDSALTLFKQVGSNLGQANVLLALAQLNGDAEQFEAAIRLYERIGTGYSVARGKAFYGSWLLDQGERTQAVLLLQEARAYWQQIGFFPGVEFVDELLQQANNDIPLSD